MSCKKLDKLLFNDPYMTIKFGEISAVDNFYLLYSAIWLIIEALVSQY